MLDRARIWGRRVGIIEQGTVAGQYEKVTEEFLEFEEAFNSGVSLDKKKEAGDIVVALTMWAELEGFTLEECFDLAMTKNESRTGKMIEGVFVKDD